MACVSGPVLAARLDTEQERAADTALAWNKGFLPRRFSLQDPPPDSAIFPFSPGLFGIGANMAVRTEFARAAGGFDEALGPGTPTHGGEDGEFMIRLILAGHAVGYEPGALLWHHHRVDGDSMREQLRGYAVGLSALLTKIALDKGARNAALKRLPAAFAQMKVISEREADAGAGMPEDTRASASAARCAGRGRTSGAPRRASRGRPGALAEPGAEPAGAAAGVALARASPPSPPAAALPRARRRVRRGQPPTPPAPTTRAAGHHPARRRWRRAVRQAGRVRAARRGSWRGRRGRASPR